MHLVLSLICMVILLCQMYFNEPYPDPLGGSPSITTVVNQRWMSKNMLNYENLQKRFYTY